MAIRYASLLCAAAAVARAAPATCGNVTAGPKKGAVASVLVLGDSISMAVPYTPGGYGVNLQKILGAKGVAVDHAGGWYAGGQCSNTPKGLLCVPSYLNFTGTYDVIQFNYGLHDLVTCDTSPECSEHVPLGTYGQNLVTIFKQLVGRAKHIVWAATTPVPNVTTSLGRTYANAIAYNAAAVAALAPVAKGTSFSIVDLWKAVIAECGVGYTSCSLQLPANVHFEPAGQQFLGETVAKHILQVLGITE